MCRTWCGSSSRSIPAASHGEEADETGIIVAGKDAETDTATCWRIDRDDIRRPNGLALPFRFTAQHKADRIVAERNNGGDMVEATIRMVDPNVPVTTVLGQPR